MLEIILKGIGIFLIIYVIWLVTGGVERGEERRAMDDDALLIELRGTALDRANSSSTNLEILR